MIVANRDVGTVIEDEAKFPGARMHPHQADVRSQDVESLGSLGGLTQSWENASNCAAHKLMEAASISTRHHRGEKGLKGCDSGSATGFGS